MDIGRRCLCRIQAALDRLLLIAHDAEQIFERRHAVAYSLYGRLVRQLPVPRNRSFRAAGTRSSTATHLISVICISNLQNLTSFRVTARPYVVGAVTDHDGEDGLFASH